MSQALDFMNKLAPHWTRRWYKRPFNYQIDGQPCDIVLDGYSLLAVRNSKVFDPVDEETPDLTRVISKKYDDQIKVDFPALKKWACVPGASPDPIVCPVCNGGSSKSTCTKCCGDGVWTCDECGADHDCGECDGFGVLMCDHCEGRGEAHGEDKTPFRLMGQLFLARAIGKIYLGIGRGSCHIGGLSPLAGDNNS